MAKAQSVRVDETRDDLKYFAMVPHIVWVVARDSYDLMFWFVIKMIAGEDGECRLDTRELAQACSMSIGKITSCRDHLIAQGVLAGEIARDGERGQASWHLRIPDLWPRNVAWRESVGNSLHARIMARAEFQEKCSPHEQKCSPHEQKCSPHEQKCSPGEHSQRDPSYSKNQKGKPVRKTSKENDDDARADDAGSSSSLDSWDSLISEYGQAEVTEALRLAGDRETDFRYVRGILRNRARRGAAPVAARRGNGRRDPYAW